MFENVTEYDASFTVTREGVGLSIPKDEANTDYQALKAWIDAGGAVVEAKKPAWMLQQ